MTYMPAEDSHLLARTLQRFARGKSLLDMGAGSGILCEAALTAGAASVCAADIDSEAVSLLKLKRIPCLQSDLFENVKNLGLKSRAYEGFLSTSRIAHSKRNSLSIKSSFDIIVCNAPYLPEDTRENHESRLATTGGKCGDEFVLRFLKQAPRHLNQHGFVLLMLSSLTPKQRMLALLKKQRLTHEIVASHQLFMERLEVWKISRIQ